MQNLLDQNRNKQTVGEIKLISECYANRCLADKLSQILKRRTGCEAKVEQSYKYGRDRIIREVLKRQLIAEQLLIAIIDYERGISRIYIDKQFELKELESNIFIGTSKHQSSIITIVFDPDIENALLCRISKELCENIFLLKRIKSRDACNIIKRFIEKSKEGENILNKLSEELINRILL